ncbi:ThiF family adenylyltransferase [Dyella caseinilytica]|uniref:ThiF family adenylyltransferase n=1 Tax=Dyella caseinilytica TaxID=1849581 RepID=A0ABX7GYL0_9GAMM|nr:ThiF family adenylyltransferase [Dyella caseinilytica]QRN55583.1 ThiF family adenylyltransferase [Dyella caseinilytica]GGA02846.1 hypothetical protein GCM10011408_25420 [Dyella caseinilytica]
MASHDWWYFDDPARFKLEREELNELAARSEWLTLGELRVNGNLRLEQEFEVNLGHRQVAFILRYPDSFPFSPPSVFPRDEQYRLSGHQYGPGGELCLEYRADNWSPEFKGWQLVQSAYNLLSGENPAPGERGEVPSAHALTEGQRTRTSASRLVMNSNLAVVFEALPEGFPITGDAYVNIRSQNRVFFITSLGEAGRFYNDESVPALIREDGLQRTVRITRVDAAAMLPDTETREVFVATAAPLGWQPEDQLFVVLQDGEIVVYRVYDTWVDNVTVLPPEPNVARSGHDHEPLNAKRVGMVGCGSLGSKVAAMLARVGVVDFVLVDDDLFLPGNVERNDLDWRDVGLHKASAVGEKLQRIRTGVKTNVLRRQLGGQESSTASEGTMAALSHCDLIFDATANPVAANILSQFATRIPVVWAEIYAGGVGGMIARHRPGKEPPMDLMRRAVDNWFREKDVPVPRADVDYGQRQGDVTMIADDADVSAIAAPATRLAIDTLLAREPSYFPNSMYIIGLSPCPLFEQPFVTYPIDLPEPPPVAEAPALSDDERREELTRIVDMFQRLRNA